MRLAGEIALIVVRLQNGVALCRSWLSMYCFEIKANLARLMVENGVNGTQNFGSYVLLILDNDCRDRAT